MGGNRESVVRQLWQNKQQRIKINIEMRHSDIHILVLWLMGQVMQMNHARTHYQAWWRHNMDTISYYWGESTRNQWIHGTTSQKFKTLIISLLWAWISLWTTSQAASEIKRVRVHGTPLSRRIRTDCKFRYMFQISIITSIIIYIYTKLFLDEM